MFTYFVSYVVPAQAGFGHLTIQRSQPICTGDDLDLVTKCIRDEVANGLGVTLINFQLLSGPNG